MTLRKRIGPRTEWTRHVLPVREFILDHLARVGEDTTTHMHQVYDEKMDELAHDRNRKTPYRKASWPSFYNKVWMLKNEGLIEESGRTEESARVQLAGADESAYRKFFRLKR